MANSKVAVCQMIGCENKAEMNCTMKMCGLRFCIQHCWHQHSKCTEVGCYASAVNYHEAGNTTYCYKHFTAITSNSKL